MPAIKNSRLQDLGYLSVKNTDTDIAMHSAGGQEVKMSLCYSLATFSNLVRHALNDSGAVSNDSLEPHCWGGVRVRHFLLFVAVGDQELGCRKPVFGLAHARTRPSN